MAWRKKNFKENRALKDLPNILEPPPDYPKLFFTPMPLEINSKYDSMVKMKQEIRHWSQRSCYFQEGEVIKKDIERYSDKYIEKKKQKFIPDYCRLPEELRLKHKKSKHVQKKTKVNTEDLDEIILKHLDTEDNEEKKDGVEEEEEGEKKKKNEDDLDEEEEEEDEDGPLEEDADYLDNYFDNGENEGYESAASNDEPIF